MESADFEKLQALMATRAGFRLSRDRMKLAEHRLGPVARREGYDTVGAMLTSLWEKPVASLGWSIIETLLNPETWFRRDRAGLDVYANEVLPGLAQKREGRPIQVWSAGCSTGQEAWSLAIAARQAGVTVEIVGTDLSRRALEKAKSGAYTGFEVQKGMSAKTMLRWFEQRDEDWSVRDELKSNVRFARANLLDAPTDDHRFDVIFCRHVLADMEPSRRTLAIENLERRLADDGRLFLAPGESLGADSLAFRPVEDHPGLFMKAPAGLSRAA